MLDTLTTAGRIRRVSAVYPGAMVLAVLADGLTYFYPWAALAIGAATWSAAVAGIGEWCKRVR